MILHGDIDVQDKCIIDSGCGLGNIGLAAILMGADHVLFNDTNPANLDTLKQHPLINHHEHLFSAQNLLEMPPHQKYDRVIMRGSKTQDEFFRIQASGILNDNGQLIILSQSEIYEHQQQSVIHYREYTAD